MKKISVGVLVAVLIAGGVYWFTYTKELTTPVSGAINAIPGNAAVIVESKNISDTWKKLSQTSVWWQDLLGAELFSALHADAGYIDSIIAKEPAIAALLKNHSVFISAHVSGATTFDFLYVYSLPNLTYQPQVKSFFQKINTNRTPAGRMYSGAAITTVYVGSGDSISYAFVDGILMMSGKGTLVEDAVRQLKSGVSLLKDKNFDRILTTAGQNVDANIYVNYKNVPGILSHYTDASLIRDVNAVPDFADCSAWDVHIKPDALLLTGFTQAKDSSAKFLNVFRKQAPQDILFTRVAPAKTSLFLFLGISNSKLYHRDYKNYLSATQQLKLQAMEQYMNGVESKYGVSLEEYVTEWISNEMALVVTEPTSTDFKNNTYAVLHSDNVEESVRKLTELGAVISNSTGKNAGEDAGSEAKQRKESTVDYRNHAIGYVNLPQLLPQLFGWPFKKIYNTYFTSVRDYVVFGNSVEALQNFIDDFENNKVLANDKNYRLFAENVSNEANIYLYSSLARSANTYAAFLKADLSKALEEKRDILYKFQAAAFQFTINKTNNLFYSSAYLKHNPSYKQESGTLWEQQLDTTLSSKPYIVVNHTTQTKEIVVQDDANKLYLISNTGKILWTKQLPEKIISDIRQVDALKNDKLQLLFNTKNAVYVYDRNGKDLRGFPIKLESPASNAVSVFDYENNRDYRVFVACENKKIRCFKLNGEEVTGFKFGGTDAVVKIPVRYEKIEGKDHLLAVDEGGKVYVLNRQGEVLVEMKERLPEKCNGFYVEGGKDYGKTVIMAADTTGLITKVSFAGTIETLKIKRFDSPVFFTYKDINNDNSKEYVFVSGNGLSVFSQNESPLFTYEFKEAVNHAPLFFDFPDGTAKIGVALQQHNELYLFNETGGVYTLFPVAGKTLFSIGDLNNNGTFMLVTGSAQKSIYVYQLSSGYTAAQ